MSVSARPRNGLTVQGGFSGGYSTSDNCAVREQGAGDRAAEPVSATSRPASCRSTRGSPAISIPKIDVALSGTFTSKPGIKVSGFGTPVAGGAFAANYTVSNAVVSQILGRPSPAARRTSP